MTSKQFTESLKIPRILIVDDNFQTLELLTRIFRSHAQVVTASDGLDALKKFNDWEYDVILLDIMLPKMDGLQVLEAIRNAETNADTPVIMISALSENEMVAKGIREGANDYITKPIDPGVILARTQTQITIKRNNDERIRLTNNLQIMNEFRVNMMRIASHDLKNPINNMRMITHLMREKIDLPTEADTWMDQVDNSLDEMMSVIEQMLDSENMTEFATRLDIQEMNPYTVIEQTIAQYQATAELKDITIHNALTPYDTERIHADANRMGQAFGNILSNAIKYSPIGSDVYISAQAIQQRKNQMWELAVRDEGEGIPESELSTLFDAFVTATPRPTADEPSTGLGLWIVRELMILQNGDVAVECPHDGGSIFYLQFPLSTDA